MVTYRKGAENIPLREINKDKQALVIVHDLKSNDIVEEKWINYGDAEHRKWLGRITFWALEHHCSVETIAKEDAEAEYVNNGDQ